MFVRFVADWQQYQGGDVRDFDKQYADQLIADGKAVYAGARDNNYVTLDPVSGALVDAAGKNYSLSEDTTTTGFPVEKVSMTASGSPCAAPCLLHRIRCLVGTSIALVVYDNPFGTSGTQLYSGTLSAGQEAVIPTPVRAINGPRGVFTGTATFEYHVSQEA